MLEIVYTLPIDLQSKLLFQCDHIDKENLSRVFHSNINNPSKSLEIIFELLKNSPQLLQRISSEDIPINNKVSVEELKGILVKHSPNNKSFISNILLKIDLQQDKDMIMLLFSNLAGDQVNHKALRVFIENTDAACLGLTLNTSAEVIEKILNYDGELYQIPHLVKTILCIRKNQIFGMSYNLEEIEADTSFNLVLKSLGEINESLLNKNNSIWNHINCDIRNTSNSNFSFPRQFSSYNRIEVNNIDSSRVLIGKGVLLLNHSSKVKVHMLSQNRILELEETKYTSLTDDKIVICNDSVLSVYDLAGNLIYVEILDDSIQLSPKVVGENKISIVLDRNRYTIFDLEQRQTVLDEQIITDASITDYIIFDDKVVFVTNKSLIIKSNLDHKCVNLQYEIVNLIGGLNSIYVITKKGIQQFDLDARKKIDGYEFIVNPSTPVVFLEEDILAYGFGNKVVTVKFKGESAVQEVTELNSDVLDIIVCDSLLTAVCKGGDMVVIKNGELENIALPEKGLESAAISAGSGIVCVTTHNTLLVCKNSA